MHFSAWTTIRCPILRGAWACWNYAEKTKNLPRKVPKAEGWILRSTQQQVNGVSQGFNTEAMFLSVRHLIISCKTRHFCSQKCIIPGKSDKPPIILLNKELDDLQQHFRDRFLSWQSWAVSITTRAFIDSIIYKSIQTAKRPGNRRAEALLPLPSRPLFPKVS